MKPLILIFVTFISLPGCAGWFAHPKDEEAVAVKEKEPAKPEKSAPTHELNSLWSDNSKWNEFYSRRSDRSVGDLLVLFPSDNFRITVANRAGRQNVEISSGDRESSHIIGKITEILPHNVYVLQAKQNLKVGNHSHPIELFGKIREQDISPDDTASTELVFDSTLKVTEEADAKSSLSKPPSPMVTMPYDQEGKPVVEAPHVPDGSNPNGPNTNSVDAGNKPPAEVKAEK